MALELRLDFTMWQIEKESYPFFREDPPVAWTTASGSLLCVKTANSAQPVRRKLQRCSTVRLRHFILLF